MNDLKNVSVTCLLYRDANKWRIKDCPEEGAPTVRGCKDTILLKFPENCMKLKKIRLQGAPLRSATANYWCSY